jgi:hypothetical protein
VLKIDSVQRRATSLPLARRRSREIIRRALHRLKLSWKKARKLLGRAKPQQREAFMAQIHPLLEGPRNERRKRPPTNALAALARSAQAARR